MNEASSSIGNNWKGEMKNNEIPHIQNQREKIVNDTLDYVKNIEKDDNYQVKWNTNE